MGQTKNLQLENDFVRQNFELEEREHDDEMDDDKDLIITKRIQDAVLDMMSKVKFIDSNNQHRYEDKNGNYLQGVSTVSSIIPKNWLSAWGAKEAVKFLGFSDFPEDIEIAKETLSKLQGMELKEYLKLLKEAKGASFRKSKDALVDGKVGHDWLEGYVKARIRGEELPKIPEGNLERPIKQFLEWEKENVKQWVLSEAVVAYLEKKYAGTLDGMAIMKDDKLAVIDYKFASHISEDYYLQTAGYQATFEPYDIKVDQRIIIRLPKTLEKPEWDKAKRKYFMVENKIEVKIVDSPYELDRDTFFHCLPLKQWINVVEGKKDYGVVAPVKKSLRI